MTARKNLLQKFGTFMTKLTPQEQLQMSQLMSAWRGPDDQNETYKTNATAVIRQIMLKYVEPKKIYNGLGSLESKHFWCPLQNDGWWLEVNSKSLETINLPWSNISVHFRAHIYQAKSVLEDLKETEP